MPPISDRMVLASHTRGAKAMTPATTDTTTDSTRGADMAHTIAPEEQGSDNGHTGTVDLALARAHGGKPATWHARRYGHAAANVMVARIVRAWRRCGDVAELATWLAPIEEAIAVAPAGGSRQLRAALADAAEDAAEARFLVDPNPETARELLRARAAERLHSLEHDREIAERFGIEL
jgi:hypothetical protein